MRSDFAPLFTLVSLCAALGAGCGGNWSNEDLEFLNALPVPADLELKVPARETTSGGLTRVKQGLGALGEEPQLYLESRRTSRGANAGVFGLLEIIETVRRYPPSTREDDQRIWGPVPDEKQPGFDVRVAMTRLPPQTFTWRIEYRQRSAEKDAPWFTFVSGAAESTVGGVRRARGTIAVDAVGARAFGLKVGDDEKIETMRVAYDTSKDPLAVHLELDGPGAALDYDFEEAESGAGAFHFSLQGDLVAMRAGDETLFVDAAWLPSGAGRAEARIDVPGYEHLRQIECWDADFRAVYLRNDFRAGAPQGSEADCPAVPAP